MHINKNLILRDGWNKYCLFVCLLDIRAFAASGGVCGYTAPPESGLQGDRREGTARQRRTTGAGHPEEARGGHPVNPVTSARGLTAAEVRQYWGTGERTERGGKRAWPGLPWWLGVCGNERRGARLLNDTGKKLVFETMNILHSGSQADWRTRSQAGGARRQPDSQTTRRTLIPLP